jgi:pyruvate/2-oxoglutarate dehydrogenase complex dihydrolipoamide acyltransferase (E2) component
MSLLSEIFVPQETVNDEFATVTKIYFKNGDAVKAGDPLIDLETSKSVVTIDAEVAGYIDLFCREGEDVANGALLLKIVDTVDSLRSDNEKADSRVQAVASGNTLFSRKALLLMEEHSVPKASFEGADFVNEADVAISLNLKKDVKSSAGAAKKVGRRQSGKHDEALVESRPVSKAKKKEIENLSDVQTGCMNSVLNVFVDIKDVESLISQSFQIFKSSYLPVVVYETSRLLSKYEALNAYYMGDTIRYHKKINIGTAIDIDDGLKVLTLPDTNMLSMHAIERELYALVDRYLEKRLDVADISASTFTITDLSSAGIDFFVPLINTGQSAILGISKVDEELKRFCLSLVFDHRVTEGRVAGEFLVELKNRIESYGNERTRNDAQRDGLQGIRCGVCFKTLKEDEEMEGVGMVKVVDHTGIENYICNVCLSGC